VSGQIGGGRKNATEKLQRQIENKLSNFLFLSSNEYMNGNETPKDCGNLSFLLGRELYHQ